MDKIKVICNTSPIIGLMSINRLSLLWQLFDVVFIPPIEQQRRSCKIGVDFTAPSY